MKFMHSFLRQITLSLVIILTLIPFTWLPWWLKNLPAMQETQVQSLGWEDPLEKGMPTHSSILAWRIPWTEGAWWTTVHGVTKSQTQLSDYHTLINARFKLCFLKSKVLGAQVAEDTMFPMPFLYFHSLQQVLYL